MTGISSLNKFLKMLYIHGYSCGRIKRSHKVYGVFYNKTENLQKLEPIKARALVKCKNLDFKILIVQSANLNFLPDKDKWKEKKSQNRCLSLFICWSKMNETFELSYV